MLSIDRLKRVATPRKSDQAARDALLDNQRHVYHMLKRPQLESEGNLGDGFNLLRFEKIIVIVVIIAGGEEEPAIDVGEKPRARPCASRVDVLDQLRTRLGAITLP